MAAASGTQHDALQPTMSSQSLDCQQGASSRPPGSGDDVGDNIRVYVRVRPPTEREQAIASQPIVSIDASTSSVLLRGDQPRNFTFDGVLDERATQEEAFELVGRSIGASCLAGYNGSVYVYGQTGVGKTYTMSGPVTSVQSMQFDERRGLICRILDYVFAEIHRRREKVEGASYLCRCSFLEIYKEQITDLLEPGNTSLQVREDMNHGVYVERLSEPTVWTLTEAFQVLWKGLQQRTIGATHMNERSSRSHAVFTLSVEAAQTRAGVTSTRIARLSLVDLAGSERQQGVLDACGFATPYQSLRVKEAGAINKSLSALTNVIMSLSREERSRRRSSTGSDGGRRQFVHYRDSKLTFLLRDSLGGNSKTVIVANMSPSALCFAETLSTLKFAARAKHIRCAAVRNEEFSGTQESLMIEVKALRQQLANLSSRGFASSVSQLSLDAASPVAAGPAAAVGEGTAAREEHEVLYSRKRVRRLEVLLTEALKRERNADQGRHQLQRLAEFLEDLDFRKSQHMRKLHNDYSSLLENVNSAETRDSPEVRELTGKLTSFRQLLAMVGGVSTNATPIEVGPSPASSSSPPPVVCTVDLTRDTVELGVTSSDTSQKGATAQPSGRKRGTSQSLQRGLSDRTTSAGGSSVGVSVEPVTDGAGLLVDEAGFLREENQRLRQQLENHPEVNRLAAENGSLRRRLASLLPTNCFGGQAGDRAAQRLVPSRGSQQRSLRSAASGSPFNSSEEDSPMSGSAEHRMGETSNEQTLGVGETDSLNALPPVTSQIMMRFSDMDEDSTLRTWIYFQKMAKEVEELLRARENLAATLEEVQRGQSANSTAGERVRRGVSKGELLASDSSVSLQRALQQSLVSNSLDPQVVDELVQTTHDALHLSQTIIEHRSGMLPLATGDLNSTETGEDGVGEDKTTSLVPSAASGAVPGSTLQRSQRQTSSTPHLPSSSGVAHDRWTGGLAGFLARNKSMRGLGLLPVGEQDQASPPSSARDRSAPPSTASAATAAALTDKRSMSPATGSTSPGRDSDKTQLRQALQRVKHLHGTLDLVNSAYNDAYDQFQRLREEYESRIEECQFYELQCSRLNIHCHELTERLHGTGASVRPGVGCFSATGLAPCGAPSSQARRSFSLSSLRDVNFWEQRFQELSQLTGIEEAGELPPGSGGGLSSSPRAPPLQLQQQHTFHPAVRGSPGAAGSTAPATAGAGMSPGVANSATEAWKLPVASATPALRQDVHSTSSSNLSLGTASNQGGPGMLTAGARQRSPTGMMLTQAVRRVSSAPLLPSYAELHGGGIVVPGRPGAASTAVGCASGSSAAAPSSNGGCCSEYVAVDEPPAQAAVGRSGGGPVGGSGGKGGPAVFDPAAYLTYARQGSEKTAPLHYARQPSSHLHVVAATSSSAVLGSGASGGSAGTGGGCVAVAAPHAPPPGVTQSSAAQRQLSVSVERAPSATAFERVPPMVQQQTSQPSTDSGRGAHHQDAGRNRVAQPPPLSLSGRIGGGGIDPHLSGASSARDVPRGPLSSGGSPRGGMPATRPGAMVARPSSSNPSISAASSGAAAPVGAAGTALVRPTAAAASAGVGVGGAAAAAAVAVAGVGGPGRSAPSTGSSQRPLSRGMPRPRVASSAATSGRGPIPYPSGAALGGQQRHHGPGGA